MGRIERMGGEGSFTRRRGGAERASTEYLVLSTRLVRALCVFATMGLILASKFHAATIFSAEKPNILLIVSDDQGWGDLGCSGLKPIQTPHLDAIAKAGVRLTNYYVTWPACTP